MKRIVSLILALVLCLSLTGCKAKEQAALLQQQNQQLESQLHQLEQSLLTASQERDDLSQQLAAAQEELQAAREALEASQTEVAALEENVLALEEEVYELKFPPLKACGTIRLFGYDEQTLTDGTFEYVLFDSFKENSGLELSAEDYTLRQWQEKNYISLDTALQIPGVVMDETQEGVRFLATVKDILPMTENVNVPTMMYHAVSDDLWGISELFVKPAEMEKQLAWLVENGYDPIWFEDLSHLEDYDKPVLLTFDDGYDDNYTILFPLLQKYNVKATIFVIGKPTGAYHKMTEEQVTEMAKSGLVSIQSHTMTHGDLSTMNEKTLHYEFSNSCKEIGALTGQMPYVLCYPSGRYNNLTLQMAKEYFAYGTKMNGLMFNTSEDDPFLISRYYIARETSLDSFATYCKGAGAQ